MPKKLYWHDRQRRDDAKVAKAAELALVKVQRLCDLEEIDTGERATLITIIEHLKGLVGKYTHV